MSEKYALFQITRPGAKHARKEYDNGEPMRPGKPRDPSRGTGFVNYGFSGRNEILLPDDAAANPAYRHLGLVRIIAKAPDLTPKERKVRVKELTPAEQDGAPVPEIPTAPLEEVREGGPEVMGALGAPVAVVAVPHEPFPLTQEIFVPSNWREMPLKAKRALAAKISGEDAGKMTAARAKQVIEGYANGVGVTDDFPDAGDSADADGGAL